jgi:hypothetical protein
MAVVRRTFAVLVCAIAIGAFAATLRFLDFFGASAVAAGFPLLSLAIVGSILVLRPAGDPIGWLLGLAGALLELVLLLQVYGSASLEPGAGLWGGAFALWLGSVIAVVPFGLVVCAMVLFPDGRAPGRAFDILLWAFAAFVVINVVESALADRPILVPHPSGSLTGDLPGSIPNPFALHGPVGDLLLLVASGLNIFLPLLLIAPLALLVRFRRSRGIERAQLKWLTYTAAITFGLVVVPFVVPPGPIKTLTGATATFGIGLLPIAIGVAVTRYRLYDIDVLIRRTLIYAAVSAVLLAAYIGGVALFQFVLAPITDGSGVAVAISTLAVLALFQPLRRRIQVGVDRRFYRSRHDAGRTLDSFTVRLRDEVDLEAVRADLVGAVRETMAPAHMSLWLREGARR